MCQQPEASSQSSLNYMSPISLYTAKLPNGASNIKQREAEVLMRSEINWEEMLLLTEDKSVRKGMYLMSREAEINRHSATFWNDENDENAGEY